MAALGWGIGKVTDGFVPSPSLDADGDLPGFQELLSTQSFVERMEAARIRRAQVLAKETQDTDGKPVFLKSTRPWEKAELTIHEKSNAQEAPQLVAEPEPAAAPLLLASSMRRIPDRNILVLANADPIVAAALPARPRITVARVAGGFALGASMGLGLAVAGGLITGGNPARVPQTETDVALAEPVSTGPAAMSPGAPESGPATPLGASAMPVAARVAPAAEPVAEPTTPALPQIKLSLPLQPGLRGAQVDRPVAAIRHQPDAPLVTVMPAQVASDAAAPRTFQAVSPPRPAPSIGAKGQALRQNARGFETDGAVRAPGVISKVALVSAPAGLTGGLTAKDTPLPATAAPAGRPKVAFGVPAAIFGTETPVSSSPGLGPTPAVDSGVAAPFALISLATPEADFALSGNAMIAPAPYAAMDDGSLIDFAAYHIMLNAPGSMKDADVANVVGSLTDAGFAIGDPVRVSFRISANQVRFFHPADAEVAQILADEIDATARDFTTFRPAPPSGSIEIWLAGAGTAKSAAKRTATKKQAQEPLSEAAKIQALRDRLILQLRTGQHL